jgi:integrase
VYKAAVIYAITRNPGPMDEQALEILNPEWTEVEAERIAQLSIDRKSNLTTLRGAQQRAEHLSKEDWIALMAALRNSGSKCGGLAADWMICSSLTGLRPCEWQHALLEGSALKVTNAKSTDKRSHGKHRTIDLHLAKKALVDLIGSFLGVVKQHQGDEFVALYNRVRDLIADVARRTLSKRRKYPTLYTSRHMFASTAKANLSKEEVAALMGHGSIDTAGRHYAAARHARGGFPLEVMPTPQDVEAVKLLNAAKLAKAFLADQDPQR